MNRSLVDISPTIVASPAGSRLIPPRLDAGRRRNGASRQHVVTVVGTRPEAIKMAPVIGALKHSPDRFRSTVVSTGQHRDMLTQVLSMFDIRPEVDLELMVHNQSLGDFAARSLAALSGALAELAPDVLLVQGDTTTVASAAMAASYAGIRVAHVEAGLRSHDKGNPFPEEINRRVVGSIADIHFAPTQGARMNLIREGVPSSTIFVTGNTIVDALQSISLDGEFINEDLNRINFFGKRVLLVTSHRRENQGAPLRGICKALRTIVEENENVEIVFPVHLNPNVRAVVRRELLGVAGIHLTDPLEYRDLLKVMQLSYSILTDSGGIQEEAPSFSKPILILRETTERPEIVASGAGQLVGTVPGRIIEACNALLRRPALDAAAGAAKNPFGDGFAAARIVNILAATCAQPRAVRYAS